MNFTNSERFDSRTGPDFYNVGLKHPVSHYIKHNIEITTSGMCSAEPLNALLWSVWLHGEAGARLAKKVGPLGFLARELANEIPALLPA